MKEIKGDLWDHWGKPNTVILITTNGYIKSNGEAVMGAGCAKQAAMKIPTLPRVLGNNIIRYGNNVNELLSSEDGLKPSVLSFPVKHNWWELADIELIKRSAKELLGYAEQCPHLTFILPRPGCGNGRLKWEWVKPILEFLPDNVEVISK